MSHPYRGGDELLVRSADLGQRLMDLLRSHFEFLLKMFGDVKRKTILEEEIQFRETAAFTRLLSCGWEFKEWFGYSCRARCVRGVQYLAPGDLKRLERDGELCLSLGHTHLHGQECMRRVCVREAGFLRAAQFELRGELPFGKASQFEPHKCSGCLHDRLEEVEQHLQQLFQSIPMDRMTTKVAVCSFEEVLCCLSYFGTEKDIRLVKEYGLGLPGQKPIPAYRNIPPTVVDQWREAELGGAEDLLHLYLRGNVPLGRDLNETMYLLTAGFPV